MEKYYYLKKGWKIGTVIAVVLMICSFSTAYQVANSSVVNKTINPRKTDLNNIFNKLKSGENVSWEELYSFLENEIKNNQNSRQLNHLNNLDKYVRFYFGDRIYDIFPYTLKVIYEYFDKPDITKKDMLNFCLKILPIYIKMIMPYKKLIQLYNDDRITPEIQSSIKVPVFIEEILGEIFNKFYPRDNYDNYNPTSDPYYENYLRYKDEWEESYKYRGGTRYDEWANQTNKLANKFGIWSIGFTIIAIITGFIDDDDILDFDTTIFFFLMMIQFIIDTIVIYIAYEIYSIEGKLEFWNVDIILHITNSSGGVTDLDVITVKERNLFAYEDYLNEDESGKKKMTEDGFYANITVDELESNPGWYILSTTKIPDQRYYYPPGKWEINISDVPEKYEPPEIDPIMIAKFSKHCDNITIYEKTP